MRSVINVFLLFALLSAGCKRNTKPTIAFIAGAATDFWTLAEKGSNQAARELPEYNVIFKYTTDGATEEQKRLVDDLLVNGVNGIAISPLDPVNQKPFIDNTAAQIPIVITDSDIPDSKRLCYIGTSNFQAGVSAGKLIRKALPTGGKIMMFVGKADAQNAKERIAGIEKELQGSGVTISGIKTDNIDRVRAKANVNDVLVSNPDVACLVGLWSYNGPAILNAVRESDKIGKVSIVCFDEEQETLAGVQKGEIAGTVVQQPYEFGYQSVKLLAKYISGDKTSVPASKAIIIPAKIIDQQNVAAFIDKMKSIRSK